MLYVVCLMLYDELSKSRALVGTMLGSMQLLEDTPFWCCVLNC